MTGLLLAFLPDSFLPVLIVFAGLALILGIASRRAVFGFIGLLLLLVFLTPFVSSLLSAFPLWLILLLGVGLFFGLFRGLLNTLFGRGATDQFVGQCMFAVFVWPFRLLGYLFRRGR